VHLNEVVLFVFRPVQSVFWQSGTWLSFEFCSASSGREEEK